MVNRAIGLGLAGVVSVTSGAPLSSLVTNAGPSIEVAGALPSPSSVMTYEPSSVKTYEPSSATSYVPSPSPASSPSLSTVILRCPPDWSNRTEWLYPNPAREDSQGYFQCINGIPMLGRCDSDLDAKNGRCLDPADTLTCPTDWSNRTEWLYSMPFGDPQTYYKCDKGIPTLGRCEHKLDAANGKCLLPADALTCPPDWNTRTEWLYSLPFGDPQTYYKCDNGIPTLGRCQHELDAANGKCLIPADGLTCPPNWNTRTEWLYSMPFGDQQTYFKCDNGIPTLGRCEHELDVVNGKCFDYEDFCDFTCPPDWSNRTEWLYSDPLYDDSQSYFKCDNGIPTLGRCEHKLDAANGKCVLPADALTCPPDWNTRTKWLYPMPFGDQQAYYKCDNGIPTLGRCDYKFDAAFGRCLQTSAGM